MNTPRHPPTDDELDQLLAGRFKDTTPAFEARWRDLKRELSRESRRPPVVVWPRLLPWIGVAAGLAAAWVLLLHRPVAPVESAGGQAALAELFEWDASLAAATPLLDGENRAALLHLPARPINGESPP